MLKKIFSRFFARDTRPVRRPTTVRPRFEPLEDYVLPAPVTATATLLGITPQLLSQGQSNVTGLRLQVKSTAATRVASITMVPHPQADNNFFDIATGSMAVFKDTNANGRFDRGDVKLRTTIGAWGFNQITVYLTQSPGLLKTTNLVVTFGLKTTVFSERVGLALGTVNLRAANGRVVSPSRVIYNGSPTVHAVQPLPTDLAATISGPSQVTHGQNAVYNVTVSNNGTWQPKNGVLRISVPDGLGVNLAQSTPGLTAASDGTLVASIGGLNALQTLHYTVVMTTTALDGNQAHVKTVGAWVSSTSPDPVPGNNLATVTTTIPALDIPALDVAVKSIGTGDIVVANQPGVKLLRFEAVAGSRSGQPENQNLTSVTVSAENGNLVNAQNYRLLGDTNGDGQVDTVLGSQNVFNGSVRFDVSALLLAGIPTAFEVHGDIASSFAGNTLQLQLDSVTAERIRDGLDLTPSQVVVTELPSILLTLERQGSLIVEPGFLPPRTMRLLAGTLGDAVYALDLHALGESIDVTRLRLTTVGGTGTSIDRLELYRPGEQQPFATATVGATGNDVVQTEFLGQTVSNFTAVMQSRQLIVQKGQTVTVLVRPRLKTDADGAFAGDVVQLVMLGNSVVNDATGEGAVHAVGDISHNALGGNVPDGQAHGEILIGRGLPDVNWFNQDIIGYQHFVVGAEISAASNANPDADGTSVPTGVSDVGQFRLTAASNNNSAFGLDRVDVRTYSVIVSAVNVAVDLTTVRLYNKANATQYVTGSVSVIDSTSYRINFTLEGSGVNASIGSGDTQTFVVQMNVLNPKIQASAASSLRVTADMGWAFKWTDRDAAIAAAFAGTDLPDLLIESTLYQS